MFATQLVYRATASYAAVAAECMAESSWGPMDCRNWRVIDQNWRNGAVANDPSEQVQQF